MTNRILLCAALAAAFTTAGCATVVTGNTVATDAPNLADQGKQVRTGSKIPTKNLYEGAELMRMSEAQRDRQATNKLVDPMIPLRDPMSGQ